MTLVVALMINNLPAILGDVLISGYELEQPLSIPTIGDIYKIFPEGTGWSITDLQQKVNIIDNNLIIGWAGSPLAARVIVSELKNRHSSQSFTKESLERFFIEINNDINRWIGKQEVGFIGYIKDSEGFHSFSHSFNGVLIHELNIPRYGNIKICGSGTYDMEQLLKQVSRRYSNSNLTNFDNVVIELLTLCGWFFADEMSTSRSLLQYYGGAYEVATYIEEEKSFQKIDDITYLTWIVQDINIKPKISLISKIFKVSYVDNILLVYTIDFNFLQEPTVGRYDSEEYIKILPTTINLYHILPLNTNSKDKMFEMPKKQELPDLINSEFNCNYLFLVTIEPEQPSGAEVICQPLRSSNKKSNYIKFIFEDEQLFLIVKSTYLEYLKNSFNVSTNS